MKRTDIFQKAESNDFDEIPNFLLEFLCLAQAGQWKISSSRENSQFFHSEKYLYVSCRNFKSCKSFFIKFEPT